MNSLALLKKTLLATAVLTSFAATAGISIIDNEKGSFSIGGDVEFDINYQDKGEGKILGDKDKNYSQTGRILIEFAGIRKTANGHYTAIKAQPLIGTDGKVGIDDAKFTFGKQDGWALTVGRFEAYDMFPVGQDTFLDYSGDTANDLYTDGAGYIYQAKEARGRSGAAGQIMYSQTFNNLYVEVGTMIGDRSDLFSSTTYHGKEINTLDQKDSVIIRPVVAYQLGDLRLSAAMERNLVKDAIMTTDGVDISDRQGYAFTVNYAINDLSINANIAHMNALDETDTSYGLNVLYKGFGIGYIYGINDFDAASNFYDGDVKLDALYASYEFANVLDIDKFSVYTGAFYTTQDSNGHNINGAEFKEESDGGVRIRLKYHF